MKRKDIRVAVLRIEGTNSEAETARCFSELGASAELVHMNQLDRSKVAPEDFRRLEDYQALMIPGGFSAGDYIRAGAIWAARLKSRHAKELEAFVAEGKPVGGICNGFQVLVEVGLLPAIGHEVMSPDPQAVLHINDSNRYECRPVHLKHVNKGRCVATRGIRTGEVRTIIASHGEGKLLYPKDAIARILKDLEKNDQILFRYVGPDGKPAGYPWNPNGAPGDVAGITNEAGTVFGMMPHPERVFHRYQHPDWTRDAKAKPDAAGDGRAIFEGVLRYVEKTL
ncbi:MAG TPA: phosphoribosylformylglycinamidine synthase subunit PurQ [Candidatus Thermoplasmatota archaeon]|nr:phosphoribosylformylglycinamidine synthase subunit PurQ [Candidatus Thermoplasmatota archaeon]